MKTKMLLLVAVIVCGLSASLTPSFAQGTAFTYQGQLQSNGSPAHGNYNLTFSLFTGGSGGSAVAGPATSNGVLITNGLFTVTIDFGASVWNGATNWLQIGVETNGGGSFTTLTPRQQITPAPYAIIAQNLASVVQFNTFIPGESETIGGGQGNTASNYWSTVGGGLVNSASGNNATVGGGSENQANGQGATVGGGINNASTAAGSTIGGGNINNSTGQYATVAGGYQNTASANYATVAGGALNVAAGLYSFAGGYDAQALDSGSFVWNDARACHELL